MSFITPALLRNLAHGGDSELVAAIAPELEAQFAPARIDSRLRLALFLAQAACETWSFRHIEEDLDYRAEVIAERFPHLAPRAAELAMRPQALGNATYADRGGDGDELSGDGFRYRGRGLFFLTFRAHYSWIGGL